MKALSIKQPWAYLIIHGLPPNMCHMHTNPIKDTENRNWNTKLRGTFLVHASTKADSLAMKKYIDAGLDPEKLVRGAIIGSVELVDVVTESSSSWFQGKYGFVLRSPIPLSEPVPWKGQLGFWECGFSNAVLLSDGKKQVIDINMQKGI